MWRNALEPWHIVVLIVVIAIVFGWKKLPDAARSLGRSMRIFKAEVEEMKHDKPTSAASRDTVDGERVAHTETTETTETTVTQNVQPPAPHVPPQAAPADQVRTTTHTTTTATGAPVDPTADTLAVDDPQYANGAHAASTQAPRA